MNIDSKTKRCCNCDANVESRTRIKFISCI